MHSTRDCNSRFHSAHWYTLDRRPKKVINYKMERGKTGSSGGSGPTICRCSVNRFLRCPQVIGTVVHAILTEWSGPTHLPKIVTEQVDVLPSKNQALH